MYHMMQLSPVVFGMDKKLCLLCYKKKPISDFMRKSAEDGKIGEFVFCNRCVHYE